MRFLIFTIALFISGCATPGPTFIAASGPHAAVLVGRSAMIFTSSSDAHVTFVEIDGEFVKPSVWTGNLSRIAVEPGRRKVTVLLSGFNYLSGQCTLELDCRSKHTYQFKVRKVGIAFDLAVLEKADPKEDGIEVLSMRIMGNQGRGEVMVPIFIPK